jgi:hypothetical protein
LSLCAGKPKLKLAEALSGRTEEGSTCVTIP